MKQNSIPGEWCIVGDFNAVACLEERKGRRGESSQHEISDFNNFIVEMDVVDVQVSGKIISWYSPDGLSMSRLDRFLLSKGLIEIWGVSGQWIGNRDLYRIIVLFGCFVR